MQQTIEQLKDLKLHGLLDAWCEQHEQPTYHDLSFDERFALLVEREYIRRQNQRLKRRLKQAQLFMGATLSEVDFQVARGLKKAQVLDWAQGQWLTQHLNISISLWWDRREWARPFSPAPWQIICVSMASRFAISKPLI